MCRMRKMIQATICESSISKSIRNIFKNKKSYMISMEEYEDALEEYYIRYEVFGIVNPKFSNDDKVEYILNLDKKESNEHIQ